MGGKQGHQAEVGTNVNSGATPLISLRAVALDTETTGLDARSAWVVEIAAVRVGGSNVDVTAVLDQCINPGVPMPKSAARIHGIRDTDVASAPRFSAIGADLSRLLEANVVIGHNTGYDLAVLEREYSRAGILWSPPRFLDVRALSRLAAPTLANYSLDALCNWLAIEICARHRALPDARYAAEIFVRLLPRLRERGIRTLAEAERATQSLSGEEYLHRLGGWIAPASADLASRLAVIESYPYRQRVLDMPLRPPEFVALTDDLRAGSLAVLRSDAREPVIVGSAKEPMGLLTATVLLAATVDPASGAQGLDGLPLEQLPTIGENEFLYRALGRLYRYNVDYLGVVNGQGEVIGLLSAADLLRQRTTLALVLGDEMEAAKTVEDLGRAWALVPSVAASTLAEDIDVANIAAIVSAEIRTLTARATTMAEARMLMSGKGPRPCAFAMLVLGSAGRGDSLLSADQDNALVYAQGEPNGVEDKWFAELGSHVADILNDVGISYCSGGVMAKNAGCRHSEASWKLVIADWVDHAQKEDALAADIFFDGVPVCGDMALASRILDFAFARAEQSPRFIAALTAFGKNWFPPISLFGNLQVDGDGRLDLKRNGLLPIVTSARAFALKHAIRPQSTLARLAEVKSRGLADGELIDGATAAFATFLREILTQQIEDAHLGIPASGRVYVAGMSSRKKTLIKTSMQAASALVATALAL